MNVIRQAHQAKVFKITVLSSFAALFTSSDELADSSRTLTDKGAYYRPTFIFISHCTLRRLEEDDKGGVEA